MKPQLKICLILLVSILAQFKSFGLNITNPKTDFPYCFDNIHCKATSLFKIQEFNNQFTHTISSEYLFKITNASHVIVGCYYADLINLRKDEFFGSNPAFMGCVVGLKLKKYQIKLFNESDKNRIKSVKLGISFSL